MGRTLDEIMAEWPPERRAAIEREAERLIAEDRTFQALREAKSLAQTELAEALRLRPASVAKLETRSDLLIATVRKHVEAMGGRLNLVVEFPDGPAVSLAGLGDTEEPPDTAPRETVARPS